MKKLNLVSVCGFGIGSSLILKMTIDKMLEQEGIEADSSPLDVTSVGGIRADIVYTSNELYNEVNERVDCPVIIIDNFLDADEVKEKSIALIKQLMNQ